MQKSVARGPRGRDDRKPCMQARHLMGNRQHIRPHRGVGRQEQQEPMCHSTTPACIVWVVYIRS
jgi:hypothetical protein